MHRLLPIVVAAWLVLIGPAATPAAAERADGLTVLYVGLDPDEPVPEKLVRYAGAHRDRQLELYGERTKAFMAFLLQHFETVGFVTGDDYDATLSDEYDVTVFDTLPKMLEQGPAGEWQKLRLPEDFDRPAVTVGEVGPLMLGRFGFGFKIDHL
ncbi:MAG: hypothetical protein ACYTGP_08840 [Planctomycetota bacterium]|jgi:hypothetical protein